MLELKNVTKIFNAGTVDMRKGLDDISITINDGDFVSIIGANGAGKSTLINAIAGTFITDSGNIIVDGEDITMMPEYKRAKFIGRMFQDPMKGTAPGMTVMENLYLAAGKGGWFSHLRRKEREELREKLAQLGMGLEDNQTRRVGTLSGGQRQALTLMMATLANPKILLLDEHTAALDPGTADKVMEITENTVRNDKLTCLMITHNMQSALSYGNRTIMMHKGKIILDVSGKEREGLTVPDLLRLFHESSGNELDNDRMLLI